MGERSPDSSTVSATDSLLPSTPAGILPLLWAVSWGGADYIILLGSVWGGGGICGEVKLFSSVVSVDSPFSGIPKSEPIKLLLRQSGLGRNSFFGLFLVPSIWWIGVCSCLPGKWCVSVYMCVCVYRLKLTPVYGGGRKPRYQRGIKIELWSNYVTLHLKPTWFFCFLGLQISKSFSLLKFKVRSCDEGMADWKHSCLSWVRSWV